MWPLLQGGPQRSTEGGRKGNVSTQFLPSPVCHWLPHTHTSRLHCLAPMTQPSPVRWHSTSVGTPGRTRRCGCTTGRGPAAEGCWPSDSESHSRDWAREQLRAWRQRWENLRTLMKRSDPSALSHTGSLRSLQIWGIKMSATKCQLTKAHRSKSRLLTFLTLNSQVMLSLNILFK